MFFSFLFYYKRRHPHELDHPAIKLRLMESPSTSCVCVSSPMFRRSRRVQTPGQVLGGLGTEGWQEGGRAPGLDTEVQRICAGSYSLRPAASGVPHLKEESVIITGLWGYGRSLKLNLIRIAKH